MAVCLRCPEIALALGLALACPSAAAQEASTESPYALHTSGLLQVDSVLLEQSSVDELDPATGEPLNQERFAIRRARVRVDGSYGYARGLVQIDANTLRGGSIRLLAAELSLGYPRQRTGDYVEAALGLFFVPFGLETSELANRRMFLEASRWVNALFPGRRDLGARIQGAWSFLHFALAVMNGNPSASAALPLRDPNSAKDFVGRIGADGMLAPGLRCTGGVSGLLGTGFHAGAPPTKDVTVVRDVNEDGIVQPSEVQLIPGDPGEASRNFDRSALGADLAFSYRLPRLGEGSLYGEIAWAKNLDRALFVADPVAQGRALRELGSMAAIRQQLTRHAEIGARFDRCDGDRDARERQGVQIVPYDASVITYAFAAAWTSLPRVRITLQYDHQQNPFGRSPSGRPTTLGADSLVLRGQLEL